MTLCFGHCYESSFHGAAAAAAFTLEAPTGFAELLVLRKDRWKSTRALLKVWTSSQSAYDLNLF